MDNISDRATRDLRKGGGSKAINIYRHSTKTLKQFCKVLYMINSIVIKILGSKALFTSI